MNILLGFDVFAAEAQKAWMEREGWKGRQNWLVSRSPPQLVPTLLATSVHQGQGLASHGGHPGETLGFLQLM